LTNACFGKIFSLGKKDPFTERLRGEKKMKFKYPGPSIIPFKRQGGNTFRKMGKGGRAKDSDPKRGKINPSRPCAKMLEKIE